MTKRRIYITPANTDLSELSLDLVTPMPGTIELNDQIIIDCVGSDSFQAPQDWTCIYEGDIEGNATIPLNMDALYPFLASIPIYDDDGNQTGTEPAERRVPHNWAGWPAIDG